jgi:glycosyltransferase involved in cell wall biosynthesis
MLSVILPVKNEGPNIKNTLDNFLASTRAEDIQLIVVDDGSDDGCCDFIAGDSRYDEVLFVRSPNLGSSNARNFGAQFAIGDVLVFADAHIKVPPTWVDGLLPFLDRYDCLSPAIKAMDGGAVGYGITVDESYEMSWNAKLSDEPFSAAINPGGFLMIRRDAFFNVGEWQKKFIVWGSEDNEFSIRLQLFGYQSAIVPSVVIEHLFRTRHPYPVDIEAFHYNKLLMAYLHFNDRRLAKIRAIMQAQQPDLYKVEEKVLAQGAIEMRQYYFTHRIYDDDWYFSKYQTNF